MWRFPARLRLCLLLLCVRQQHAGMEKSELQSIRFVAPSFGSVLAFNSSVEFEVQVVCQVPGTSCLDYICFR